MFLGFSACKQEEILEVEEQSICLIFLIGLKRILLSCNGIKIVFYLSPNK